MSERSNSAARRVDSTRVYPRGRRDLLVTGMGDEIQLYDRAPNRTYLLNRLAAITWEESDGYTSVASLRQRIEVRIGAPVAEEVVWHSLQQLERMGLVSQLDPSAPRFTRGQLIKGGLIWSLGLLPIIKWIPSAAPALASPAAQYATNTPTPTNTPTNTPTPTNTATATATPVRFEGCGPGFWKEQQHFDSWTAPYDPTYLVKDVFNVSPYLSSGKLDLDGDGDDDTLLDALKYVGGSGVEGAVRNLLRATVAALLNAASPDVDYSLSVNQVIAQVNAALASRNRSSILQLASDLDGQNNQFCPLD